MSLVLVSCASGPPPPVVPEAVGVEPISGLRMSCSHPVELTRDCSGFSGASLLVTLDGEPIRVAGSADGRHVLVQVEGLLDTARGGPGYVSERSNRAFAVVKAALERQGIGLVSATPVISHGALFGYLLELDSDGYGWLAAQAAASQPAVPAAAPGPRPPEAVSNVRDADATIAFVHFRPSDMPIVVELPRPPRPPADGSSDEAVEAVRGGFEAWRDALEPVAPWVEFDVAMQQQKSADVRITWAFERWSKKRFIRVVATDPPRAKPAVEIPLSAPSSSGFTLDWLRRASLYAAGFALGLNAADEGETVMNRTWLMAQDDAFAISPTPLDVESFCALSAQPSGLRIDGTPMRSLSDAGWAPPSREELVAPCP